jgi:hypothetical protein
VPTTEPAEVDQPEPKKQKLDDAAPEVEKEVEKESTV